MRACEDFFSKNSFMNNNKRDINQELYWKRKCKKQQLKNDRDTEKQSSDSDDDDEDCDYYIIFP
jgi:hypothetical protein